MTPVTLKRDPCLSPAETDRGILPAMGSDAKVSAERAKQLADELSALSKQQSKALQTAAYINMSREETKEYDQRHTRISEIWALLGKVKPPRNGLEPDAEFRSGASLGDDGSGPEQSL